MNLRRLTTSMIGAIGAIHMSLVAPVVAQDQELAPEDMDLPELVQTSIMLMRQEQWAQALKFNEVAAENFGTNAMAIYGPRFGGIHFRKGVCELKLEKWDAAMKSFETCYKEFPNKEADRDNQNPFEKTCLLQWAEAAMGKKEWQMALDLFEKFLKERDKQRDKFQKGSFYISLAVCHYNLGDIAKGNENLEIAIKNKQRFQVPDASLLGAFRYLVDAAIKAGNEQALIDFISKNRGEITIDPYDMYPYAGLFMKKATVAIKANMTRAALEIYQLIPSTAIALSDAQSKLQDLGPLRQLRTRSGMLVKEQLEKGIEQLEKADRGGKSLEMVKLAAIAYLHEQHGNVGGSYAAYKQLETYHSHSENRENNLYNLARVSFMVDIGPDNLADARKFLKLYPDSKHAPLIQRLSLSTLFAERRYDDCISRANAMLPTLKAGTPQHDLCLHVLGGSYFYTGQYEQAKEYLDQHVEQYPDSESAISSAYFQAANEYRMGNLEKAGGMLDDFVAKHSDPETNSFLPYAYLDRATCHYYLEKNQEALKVLDTLIEKFNDSNVIDQAYNLRGNILVTLEEPLDAEAAYKQGLRLAERINHSVAAGESLYNLVELLVTESKGEDGIKRLDEALGYIKKFWDQYADGSPYASGMAVNQLPVLKAAGRLDEGVERLRKVITAMANNPDARGLEEKLDIYTEAYLESHSVDQLKDHYLNFPGVPIGARAARALLQIQIISAYEDLAKSAQDNKTKIQANAMVKASFARLKSDFDTKDLASSILIKVGDYLRQKTSTPREALPFYNEVIERNDMQNLYAALLGRADIYGDSSKPADIDKALADFEQIFNSTEEKKEKEFALFRMVQLLVQKEDYAKAAEKARLFLNKENGFSKSRKSADVGLLLAKSFEGRKLTEDAIAMYAKVWATNIGTIRASAPAMQRWMELLWDRNKPAPDANTYGDRQGAYVAGAKYIKNTTPIKGKMTSSDLQKWQEVEQLVQKYEANPNVKSLEQIKRENENR